ncbi:flavin-nucleotide-binding protein [Burkholderia cenocepacia]|nr:flavin-nucleotide-binding protein [Burkholderia cenocepacia]
MPIRLISQYRYMNDQTTLSSTSRTTIRRLSELASHDRTMLHHIVDDAYVCHIAFGDGQNTHCIPTAHWRRGDALYIHGSNGSRMIKALSAGAQACVAMTLLDGLVLARSAFNHSMNYRSAVIYGQFDVIDSSAEKRAALDALMDKIAPGRKHEARPGNSKELDATRVLRISMAEAAVKISDSLPSDKDEDLGLAVWAGILPLKTTRGAPVHADGNVAVPDYVRNWAD